MLAVPLPQHPAKSSPLSTCTSSVQIPVPPLSMGSLEGTGVTRSSGTGTGRAKPCRPILSAATNRLSAPDSGFSGRRSEADMWFSTPVDLR